MLKYEFTVRSVTHIHKSFQPTLSTLSYLPLPHSCLACPTHCTKLNVDKALISTDSFKQLELQKIYL